MQVSNNYHNSIKPSNSSILEQVSLNLDREEKKLLREALLKVPSEELPKVLNEISKVPVDENYFKEIMQKVQQAQNQQQGFVIYA